MGIGWSGGGFSGMAPANDLYCHGMLRKTSGKRRLPNVYIPGDISALFLYFSRLNFVSVIQAMFYDEFCDVHVVYM